METLASRVQAEAGGRPGKTPRECAAPSADWCRLSVTRAGERVHVRAIDVCLCVCLGDKP